MAESFKLELPEPDPDDEPLELEEELRGPEEVRPVRLPAWLQDPKEEKLPPGQVAYLPPEPELPADADELWEENNALANRDLARFSLAEMLIFTLLLAVMLTIAKFVSLPVLAGFLGGAVLIGLVILATSHGSRTVYMGWITLLVSYVLIAIWAALRAG